jgi:hypothetical protein
MAVRGPQLMFTLRGLIHPDELAIVGQKLFGDRFSRNGIQSS